LRDVVGERERVLVGCELGFEGTRAGFHGGEGGRVEEGDVSGRARRVVQDDVRHVHAERVGVRDVHRVPVDRFGEAAGIVAAEGVAAVDDAACAVHAAADVEGVGAPGNHVVVVEFLEEGRG